MKKYLFKNDQFSSDETDEYNENNKNKYKLIFKSLLISYNHILLIYIHFCLCTYHLHIPLALVLADELAWFYGSISIKSFSTDVMNHSCATQAVSKGQIVRDTHNANLPWLLSLSIFLNLV